MDALNKEIEKYLDDAAQGVADNAELLAHDLSLVVKAAARAQAEGNRLDDVSAWAAREAAAIAAQHALNGQAKQKELLQERIANALAFAVRVLALA